MTPMTDAAVLAAPRRAATGRPAGTRSRLAALDGLRGVAAIWVLAGHVVRQTGLTNSAFWILARNGLAVDLFMLLSGYLMYALHGDAYAWPRRFWLRRFFRLASLYYLCLGAGFALAPAFVAARHALAPFNGDTYGGWPISATVESLVVHLSLLFGLSPYFGQSTPLPDWSLTLEVQFYIFFPALAGSFLRLGPKRAAVIWTVVQAALLLALQGYFSAFWFATALPLKLNIFLAGMLVASRRPADLALAAVLVLPTLASRPGRLVLTAAPAGPVRLALVLAVIVCTAAPSSSLPAPARYLRRLLSSSSMTWLGQISYGIYLTHVLVLWLTLALLIRIPGLDRYAVAAAGLLVTVAVTLPLAHLLHRRVEAPGVALGRRLTGSRRQDLGTEELP